MWTVYGRQRPQRPTLFPYTTLFRSARTRWRWREKSITTPEPIALPAIDVPAPRHVTATPRRRQTARTASTSSRRSEEHTSELQSRRDLVCRLLLEKKKTA